MVVVPNSEYQALCRCLGNEIAIFAKLNSGAAVDASGSRGSGGQQEQGLPYPPTASDRQVAGWANSVVGANGGGGGDDQLSVRIEVVIAQLLINQEAIWRKIAALGGSEDSAEAEPVAARRSSV